MVQDETASGKSDGLGRSGNPGGDKASGEGDKMITIKQWTDALRSGMYTQGFGRLHYGKKFCAMGVACDLNGGGWEKDSRGVFYCLGLAYGTEPKFVHGWKSNTLPFNDRSGKEICLADLNDDDRMPFPKLADVIDYVGGV